MTTLHLSEVIVSSDVGGDIDTEETGNICVWDISTGSGLACYKDVLGPVARGLSLVKKNYLLSASEDELCIWALTNTSNQSAIKMEVPSKVSSLAVSPDGSYCVAGIQEKLYIWCVLTGQLLAVIHQRHFQNIVCIKFADNLIFLTGSEDNQIIVWSLVDIFAGLDNESDNKKSNPPEPLFVWHDHTLPITDIYVGAGGIRARAVSTSLDRTCKFWDLATGRLLCSFMFSESLLSVTMNMAENRLYAGGSSGKIYVMDLSQRSAKKTPDAEGNYGSSSDKNRFYFLGHNKRVTCLSVSMDGFLLVSGSDDCTVKVWDTVNGQCLRTLVHNTSVTNAFIAPLSRSVLESSIKQSFPIGKFQTEVTNVPEDNITSVLLPNYFADTSVCSKSYPFQSDLFANILAGDLNCQILPSDTVAENEEQSSRERNEMIAKLKKEIEQIKSENEKLFSFSVSQVLK